MALLGLGLAGATLINVHQAPQTVFYAEFAAALGVVLAFMAAMLARPEGLELRLGVAPWLALLLGLACLAWGLGSRGLGYPAYLSFFVLAYLLGAQLRGESWMLTVALGLFGCALLQSLAGLAQLLGWDLGGLVMQKIYRQAFGNVGQANHYANLLFLGLASLAWLHARRLVGWFFLLLLAAWLALAAAASASRGAWLYTAAFLVLGLVSLRGDEGARRLGRALLLAALCSVVAQLLVTYGDLLDVFGVTTAIERAGDAGSNGQRLYNWLAAWQSIQAHPWLGTGPGSFYQASIEAMFHTPPAAFPKFAEHAHNLPLQLAAEFGLPLAVLLILGLLWWYVHQLFRAREAESLWALACVAVIGLHSLVEYPLWYVYFIVPLGLAMGVADATDRALPVLHLPRWPGFLLGLVALLGCLWALHDWHAVRQANRLLTVAEDSASRVKAAKLLDRVLPWSVLAAHAEGLRLQAWAPEDGGAAAQAARCDAFWQRKPSWFMMQRCAQAYALTGQAASLERIAVAFCDGFRFHRPAVLAWGEEHDAAATGLRLAGLACFPPKGR
ncbi:MAG: hypothetical protein BSR46_09395 [Candidatus Dactylopiibacterium carminicum]|nr:MAG: hypothetical protein BSR46_09395 [Candidatus Dactylopiibacterium carminicum]